jgi:hypothetical protein
MCVLKGMDLVENWLSMRLYHSSVWLSSLYSLCIQKRFCLYDRETGDSAMPTTCLYLFILATFDVHYNLSDTIIIIVIIINNNNNNKNNNNNIKRNELWSQIFKIDYSKNCAQ